MHLSSSARKALAAGLAASTVLASTALFALPLAFAAPHSNGCLVNAGGTIWLIEGGMRKGFPSAEVFSSNGYSFSQVVAANSDDTSLPVGPVVRYADGTLVKGPSDPLVYLVANGQKRGFVSGSVFTGLGFSFGKIWTAAVNTFADMPTGANLESATERHTNGVLVKDGSGTVWWMTATGRMGIPSMEVFNSYGLMWDRVVAANAADLASNNEGVLTARATCTDTGTGPTVPAGSVSVSLASDNPASTTLVAGQSGADIAHFSFSGSGTVTSVNLKKLGVAADATLSNVYLYDGQSRLTDSSSVTSGGNINFTNGNGLFTVSGSKTITVRSDVATGTSGQTVGVQLVSAMSGSAAVSGVPVSGNVHTIATVSNVATASLGTATPSSNGDISPGNDQVGWQNTLTIGNSNVLLTRLMLKQIGSVNNADVRNYRLYVDGNLVSTVSSLDANGYITFTPSTSMQTGARTLKVLVDVVGGSSRSFSMSLQNAVDLGLMDTVYNVGIAATGTIPSTTGIQSILAGAATVQKATTSASGNVTSAANDVPVATWTVTANGEPVKVNNLKVQVNGITSVAQVNTISVTIANASAAQTDSFTLNGTTVTFTSDATPTQAEVVTGLKASIAGGAQSGVVTTSGTTSLIITANTPGTPFTIAAVSANLSNAATTANFIGTMRNGRLLVNGVQVGNTQTFTALVPITINTNFTVTPGSPATVELRGDMSNSAGVAFAANTTVSAQLNAGASNAQGQTSFSLLSVPGSTVAGNTLTVISGAISMAKNATYANQNTTVPQSAYKLASFNLTGNSAEDVNLNTVQVDFASVGGSTFTAADLNNVYVKVGNTTLPVKSTVSPSNTYSVNYTLPKGQTAVVEVYGDIASGAITATDSVRATVTVYGTTAQSSQSVNTTAIPGQTIAYQTGSITSVAGAMPLSKIVSAPQSNMPIAAYNVTGQNDNFTITDATVAISGTNATTVVSAVHLTDGSNTYNASINGSGNAVFSGMSIPVTANVSKTLTVTVDLSSVGSGAGSTGSQVAATLTAATATSNSIGSGAVTLSGSQAGNMFYVYKAIPTVTLSNASTAAVGGNQALATVTVGSTGGQISWKDLTVAFSVTGSVTAGTFTMKDSGGNSIGTCSVVNTSYVNCAATNEQFVTGNATYTIYGVVGGTITANDRVSITLAHRATGYNVPATYGTYTPDGTTNATTDSSFTWSDGTVVPHSTSSADWNNDFLVQNFQ